MLSGERTALAENETLLLVFRPDTLQDMRLQLAERGATVGILPMISRKDKRTTAERYAQMAVRVFEGKMAEPLDPMARDPQRWVNSAMRAMQAGGYVVSIVEPQPASAADYQPTSA